MSRLGAAMTTLERARASVLGAGDAVIAAATALDAADQASALGAREDVDRLRVTARAAVPQAQDALKALPAQLHTYRVALDGLAAAAAAVDLNATQRPAVGDVVTAGRREADVLDRFRARALTAWDAYGALNEAESTWLDRASAGWYRTTQESANAYAVLTSAGRPVLDAARATLLAEDQSRREAVARTRAVLQAADRALAPLRSG